MEKLYIPPEAEIVCFLPMENMANGIDWYNGDAVEPDDSSGMPQFPAARSLAGRADLYNPRAIKPSGFLIIGFPEYLYGF